MTQCHCFILGITIGGAADFLGEEACTGYTYYRKLWGESTVILTWRSFLETSWIKFYYCSTQCSSDCVIKRIISNTLPISQVSRWVQINVALQWVCWHKWLFLQLGWFEHCAELHHQVEWHYGGWLEHHVHSPHIKHPINCKWSEVNILSVMKFGELEDILYSGKLSREKTFAKTASMKISQRKLSQIHTIDWI